MAESKPKDQDEKQTEEENVSPDGMPLIERPMEELQAMAKKMGFANPDVFTVKKQVIAVINEINTRNALGKSKPDVSIANVPVATDNLAGDRKRWKGKAMIMKEKLDKQPKVQVFLSLSGKEKPGVINEAMVDGKKKKVINGAYETVILNGYTTYIPKGAPVLVAQQVAETLGQAQKKTMEAGSNFLVDRDEKVEKALG